MGFLINQYQGFSGNAVEMASVATECAKFLQMPGDLDKINERLVRYYVAEGLVDRPKRIGRDAEYDYFHLLQFLAGRFLVDAGFPMQKVAPYLTSLEIAQLEALVMNKTKPNMAELLVASFASPNSGARSQRKDEDWLILNKGSSASSASSSGPRIRVAARPASGGTESIRYESLSADLNAFASGLQSSVSDLSGADPIERLNKLSDQMNYLADSVKQGLSELLDRGVAAADKEGKLLEERFERMRLVMQKGWAEMRYEIDHERQERQMQFLETQEKLNKLMAMMAEQGKGKEND